jgi:hypothetical protein
VSSITVEDFLEHNGVKGMKWGVRKDERLTGHANYTKDFTQKDNVYRIVAAQGSRKLSDIAYVSSNDVDNKRYIHILNHTISARLIKSARYEKQLVLGPKEPLRAPSITKAESEMQKLYKTSPAFQKFVKDNELYFGENPDAKKLNQLTNTALVDDDALFAGSIAVRPVIKQHFQKLGYNSMLDQNDIREGLAKSPLIVFDPEKTLRVVSQSKIDDVIKKAATKTYKETRKSF